MYYIEKRIPDQEVANCFSAYFEDKVNKIVKNAIKWSHTPNMVKLHY